MNAMRPMIIQLVFQVLSSQAPRDPVCWRRVFLAQALGSMDKDVRAATMSTAFFSPWQKRTLDWNRVLSEDTHHD